MDTRAGLRREMRRRRRELSPVERQRAAHAVLKNLKTVLRLRRGMKLAVYLPHRGELETRPIIEYASARGCVIYVPVLDQRRGKNLAQKAHQRLQFVALTQPWRKNRYGIHEPGERTQTIPARQLNAVITPLVGFGPRGARLGSGAGFYDQTFAFLKTRKHWNKPHLIGVAYHWQHIATLTGEAWDVPLDVVVTDEEVIRFDLR